MPEKIVTMTNRSSNQKFDWLDLAINFEPNLKATTTPEMMPKVVEMLL
jgi:hypothetical protein